ncbi:MAG: HAD family phosphatase, partial [Cyanobacteria bacterium J149]
EEYLEKLIQKKAEDYRRILEEMEKLPSCDRITEFILSLQSRHLSLGIVTGALRTETEYILERMNIRQYFSVIVAGDDIKTSKPSGDGYLLAVEKLNQQNPSLELKPSECLVIEDTPAGIEAGKKAGMAVAGVANTYPLHLLQRQANWCVDNLMQLDLDWINDTMKANFTL